MKTCGKCNTTKEESEFYFKNKKKGIRQSYCRVCSNKSVKKHYRANLDEYKDRVKKYKAHNKANNKHIVDNYKVNAGCKKCGYNEHAVGLDLHHIDNNKDNSVSRMVSDGLSTKTVMKEVYKCIVLCAICHRVEHLKKNRDV